MPISFSLDRLSHYGVGCSVFKEVFGSLPQSLFTPTPFDIVCHELRDSGSQM